MKPASIGRTGSTLPLLFGVLLLPIVWLGLNGGAWVLPTAAAGFDARVIRSIAPMIVLAAAAGVTFSLRGEEGGMRATYGGPLGHLALYALVGLFGGLLSSPDLSTSVYWGLAFLAVPMLFAASTGPRDGLGGHTTLMRLTLLFVVGVAALLAVMAIWAYDLPSLLGSRDLARLFGNYEDDIAPALAINANGAARFLALAALVLVSWGFASRSKRTSAAWVGGAGLLLVILVFTQSRTTLVAAGVAAFALIFLHAGLRTATVSAAGVAVATTVALGPSTLIGYISRGQSGAEFFSLTGRTGTWAELAKESLASPLWGHGFHADRLLVAQHTHDAWLHAFAQAGILGLGFFLFAWVLAWKGTFNAGLRDRFENLRPSMRISAINATVVLTFLTVRSIPESTAAFYGVDLFIFVPVAAFLHALGNREASRRERRLGDLAGQELAVEDVPRILTSSYACAPPGSPTFHGGEELLGWKLTTEISKGNETWALISEEHRESVEAALTTEPDAYPNLCPVYIGLPRWLSWMRNHQGTIQLYAYLWQLKAYVVAEQLHDEIGFDTFHHITYANDWMASHAGALLDVPYVRGPGGGAQQVPASFRSRYGLRFRFAQRWRSGLQGLFRADPFFRRGQERADRLLVCTPESREAMPERWREKTEFFPVNGIDTDDVETLSPANSGGPFTVIVVGKHLKLKGFDLAIEAFGRFQEGLPDTRLMLVGRGPETEQLELLVEELGVRHAEFTGWLPHDETLERIREADVLLFPSLRDGGGGVVVEAMALGTVAVCLDLAGPGLHTAHGHGVAVPARNPEQAIDDLACALRELHDDPQWREVLQSRARERVLDRYTWEGHGERLQRIYDEILGRAEPATPVDELELPQLEPLEESTS